MLAQMCFFSETSIEIRLVNFFLFQTALEVIDKPFSVDSVRSLRGCGRYISIPDTLAISA